jgi:hypothetical protein
MNYFYILAACLFLSICSKAQTTVCLISGDTVLAGGDNKSVIKSVRGFNFVYEGPLDTAVVSALIGRVAEGSKDFTTFSSSCALGIKDLCLRYFSNIQQKDSTFFNEHIIAGQVSRTVGSICLFGVENNKPVLNYLVFYLNKGIRHPVVVSYSLQPQYMAVFSDGTHPRHKGIVGNLEKGGAVMEIKKMIGIATEGPIDGSGPPIDVLVITKNGVKWIRK